jgi:mono/diheme cytochrome c family protein
MDKKILIASAAIALASAAGFATATPRTITLPADGTQLRPSALPGYAKAQANCVGCHSAEYFLYQPPNAGRAYWDAMAKRMKAVFKAPLDDADIPVIVDYLSATYGNKTP